MFTGIIENFTKVEKIEVIDSNIQFTFSCPFTHELKVDQSVAHNGVCLTVTSINDNLYTVVAIKETLDKTNLGQLKVNDLVNIERCMVFGGRVDGHMVQGHVDQTGTLKEIIPMDGSYELVFEYDQSNGHMTVPKGSITINGISLTVVQSAPGLLSVCIIPYTWEHTNLQFLKVGDLVNLEFDILGKYITQYLKQMNGQSIQ